MVVMEVMSERQREREGEREREEGGKRDKN